MVEFEPETKLKVLALKLFDFYFLIPLKVF
jgi:hypothetical protein